MRATAITLIGACSMALLTGPAVKAQEFEVTRVSVSSNGVQADDSSALHALSQDGRWVAFGSDATNLVAEDLNHKPDVFLHDRIARTTVCVSIDVNGLPAGGYGADISGDGRFVSFFSDGTYPTVPRQVYVFDRLQGTTEMISVSPSGAPGDQSSEGPTQISADARWVAFKSTASNLVQGGPDGARYYVRDRRLGVTTKYCPCDGSLAGNHSIGSMSGDGKFLGVTYTPPKGYPAGIIINVATGEYVDVSYPKTDHCSGWYVALGPELSFDARFSAHLLDFVLCDDKWLVVRDALTDEMKLVSIGLSGGPANAWEHALSADGRRVAFASKDGDYVVDDTNDTWDVFERNIATGETVRVSVAADGSETHALALASYPGSYPDLDPQGRVVAYSSSAPDIVPMDTNDVSDVFVFDRDPWFDVGGGLAGIAGIPLLGGHGALEPGTLVTILLTRAAPASAALLFVSNAFSATPFKGGQLAPFPPLLLVPLLTDGAGMVELQFPSPSGLPAGLNAFLQAAIDDTAAPKGVALSNVLKVVVP